MTPITSPAPSTADAAALGRAEPPTVPAGASAPDAARRLRLSKRTSPRTLGEAFRIYAQNRGVIAMALALALAVGLRIRWGGFSVWDVVVLLGFALYQPFQEWLIHVYLLHFRPRKVLGREIDLEVAKKHRRHHEDPSNLSILFIPEKAIIFSAIFHPVLWSLVMPTPGLAATACASIFTVGLLYEWTHFLIHTSYAPRGRFYRELWRLHRLHHYKNEGYWFGVTGHLGDRVLGTNPDPKDVPLSPTARSLLGASEEKAAEPLGEPAAAA